MLYKLGKSADQTESVSEGTVHASHLSMLLWRQYSNIEIAERMMKSDSITLI